MPVRGIIGTDYLQIRPDFKVMDNPYGEDKIVVVPAIVPEVALIHAKKADRKGNILVDRFENDPLLARASGKVFASCEEVVENVYLELTPEDIVIPSIYIRGVIVAPGGAAPTRCQGYYEMEDAAMQAYIKASREESTFASYLQDFLQGA